MGDKDVFSLYYMKINEFFQNTLLFILFQDTICLAPRRKKKKKKKKKKRSLIIKERYIYTKNNILSTNFTLHINYYKLSQTNPYLHLVTTA